MNTAQEAFDTFKEEVFELFNRGMETHEIAREVECSETIIEEILQDEFSEISYEDNLSDVEADAMTLASAGMGTNSSSFVPPSGVARAMPRMVPRSRS